jgi:hypothetical protein
VQQKDMHWTVTLKVQGRVADKENLERKKNGNCRRQEKAREMPNNLLWTKPNGRPSRRLYVPQRNKRSK